MDPLLNLLTQPNLEASSPLSVLKLFFISHWWGWVIIFVFIFPYLQELWLSWRQDKYAATVKWTYLAIDVPKDNMQTPKAVEQIFNHLWGTIRKISWYEKWWEGKYQLNFSLELVSIEGYIQYIIRTPTIHRDLLEAAIYAQYPEAQITEIEDYTQSFTPEDFKQKGYELRGAQMGLTKDEVYPIKTYPLFEHSIAQTIVDPLASLLEILTRFSKGEHLWIQIVIKPNSDDWKEKSLKEVKKLIGAPVESKKTIIDKIMEKPHQLAHKTGDVVFGAAEIKTQEKMEIPSKMLYLSPGERETVESIDRKATKTGFKTKIRFVYLAKKEVLNKPKGLSGIFGAFKQFGLLNANGFKPASGTFTSASYDPFIRPHRRVDKIIYKLQRKLLKNYKSRSQWGGAGEFGGILNTEELASIYHFPFKGTTTTAAVKTAESKRVEAPMTLPIEEEESITALSKEKQMAAPENLPV